MAGVEAGLGLGEREAQGVMSRIGRGRIKKNSSSYFAGSAMGYLGHPSSLCSSFAFARYVCIYDGLMV